MGGILAFGLFTWLYETIANVSMTIFFIPYRMLTRLSEKSLARERTTGWETTLEDQLQLRLAGQMAMTQAIWTQAYPVSADRAIRATQAMGVL